MITNKRHLHVSLLWKSTSHTSRYLGTTWIKMTLMNGCRLTPVTGAWLRVQDEASPHNLSVLRELREIAAKKKLSGLTQGHMTDYFFVQDK